MSKVLKIAGAVVAIGAAAIVTGGAALGAAGVLGTTGAAGGITAAIGATIGSIGLSLGAFVAIGTGLQLAGGLLAKKPQVSPSQVERTKVSLQLDAPRKIVFGDVALSTTIDWIEV